MKMKILTVLAMGAALATASVSAQTFSKNRSYGGGSGGGGVGGMPTDFSVLQTKSIFNKDRRPGFSSRPWGQDPNRNPDGSIKDRGRNRVPALRGIIHQPDGYVGLLEVPRSGDIVIIRKGDSLPNNEGTVTDISLDSIGVGATADQPVRKILVGQNIHGIVAEVETSSSSSSSEAASSQSSGNNGGDNGGDSASASPGPIPDMTPPVAGGASLDEIRAKLMARRKQQNGGK